jgi:hypothetical protein
MNRQGLLTEQIGKGIALGLLAMLAVVALRRPDPDIAASLMFGGCTLAGLLLALVLAAWRTRGQRRSGHFSAYLLCLLLDYPALMHLGILGGMFAGAILLRITEAWAPEDLYIALGVGLGIGLLFAGLPMVKQVWWRRGIILLLAAGATAGLVWLLEQHTGNASAMGRNVFGGTLLAVIPALYLLTFTGRAEETELEIGIVCVALGLALWLLVPPTALLAALAVPLLLYIFYTTMYLSKLRTFKHVLRGMSHAKLGQVRPALLAYRRALQYAPQDNLAREQFWRLHQDLDWHTLHDPQVLQLVDFDLCLDRAGELLLSGSPPAPQRMEEALKLLNLVLEYRPTALPAVYYWRAVAHTHRQEFDKAEQELRTILDEAAATPEQKPYRQRVLVPAWQLALTQHPELKKRVGEPLLHEASRRFAAIAAVEEALARDPQEGGALELKPLLYGGVTLAAYQAEAGTEALRAASAFDHAYCSEIGTPLLSDPQQWRHGVELLRIAARGLPQQGPALLRAAAQAAEQQGDQTLAQELLSQLLALARQLGVKELSPEAREAYFAVVRQQAERAYNAGNVPEAIRYFTLYTESDKSGQDTVRILTELYEKQEDVPNALFYNERCLMYDARNPLYLERKDRYYYSLMPEQYPDHAERLEKVFDLDYCLSKAKKLLEVRNCGPEQQDWALHLTRLVLAVAPENIAGLVLAARAHLRRGETDEALTLLEKARAGKERRQTADDEEAWYLACRLLGDLYLQAERPAEALECLKDYRSSAKSGADTVYRMAQAYEQMGDRLRASKLYENVAAYEGNPLADDARQAIDRLAAMTE